MLFRLAHLELRPDLSHAEADRCRELLRRMAEAEEVAWLLVGEVCASGAAPHDESATIGFLIAFDDEDAFRRWCVNEELHLDCSDYVMPRCVRGLRDLAQSISNR